MRDTDATAGRLTHYEHARLDDLAAWYELAPGATERLLAGRSRRARAILDLLLGSPRVRDAVARATERVLDELEPRLLHRVDEEPVRVHPSADAWARTRALQDADRRVDRIRTTYVGWLSTQAAVVGASSATLALAAATIAADVASAVVGSLRAAAHVLLVYGVERGDPRLLPSAVDLVSIANETDVEARRRTIRSVVASVTGSGVPLPSDRRIPRIIVQQTGSRAVRETIEQTVRRALRQRAVTLVPVLGGLASGVASGWLTNRVVEGARHAGTMRFLHEHAGTAVPDRLRSVT